MISKKLTSAIISFLAVVFSLSFLSSEFVFPPRLYAQTVDQNQTKKVKLIYEPRPGEVINSIAVAGSFNNWNSSKDLMTRRPSDGKYEITIPVERDGVYYYKLVINGKNWIEDPLADKSLRKEDGFGGFNSGFVVGETGARYGSPIPGGIVKNAVFHDPSQSDYFNMITPSLVEIKLRTLAGDVSDVSAVFADGRKLPMEKSKTYLGFDYWTVYADGISSDGGKISYGFELADGKTTLNYPFTEGKDDKKSTGAKLFTASGKVKFSTPDWAKNAVWYQVMLDRFYDGEPANNPEGTLPWRWDFAKVHPSEKGNFYEVVWGRYFGGDLQGLIQKLDYLKELGVTAIYLTPVFKAPSSHKYNTADYRHIDDHLGFKGDIDEVKKSETDDPKTWRWTKTDKLFLDFLKKAKAMGFHVIIDGVFNHCGENFWAFEDVKKNGRASKYAGWFDIYDWDLFMREAGKGKGYRGWAGFGGLPEYREDSNGLVAGPKKHIFDITRRWMDPNGDGDPSDGIDGWRLDVPDNVKMPFWQDWSQLVKSINPDAYIAGELWDEAPAWLNEKMFHAQMNYPFIKTTLNWLSNGWIKPSQFDNEIKHLLSLYPYQVNLVQMNLFDSHDTDRAVSMLANPGRNYDKKNRLNPSDTGDYNPSYFAGKPSKKVYDKLKLVTAVQFTLPGAPMIWYGDEAGMWGSDDPFSREPMIWKEKQPYDDKNKVFMPEIFEHYRKLIAIHNTYPPLKYGIYESVVSDDDSGVLVYARRLGKDRVYVVVNNSPQTRDVAFELEEGTPDGTEYFDILGEKKYSIVRREKDEPASLAGVTVNKIIVERPSKTWRSAKSILILKAPPQQAMILVRK